MNTAIKEAVLASLMPKIVARINPTMTIEERMKVVDSAWREGFKTLAYQFPSENEIDQIQDAIDDIRYDLLVASIRLGSPGFDKECDPARRNSIADLLQFHEKKLFPPTKIDQLDFLKCAKTFQANAVKVYKAIAPKLKDEIEQETVKMLLDKVTVGLFNRLAEAVLPTLKENRRLFDAAFLEVLGGFDKDWRSKTREENNRSINLTRLNLEARLSKNLKIGGIKRNRNGINKWLLFSSLDHSTARVELSMQR